MSQPTPIEKTVMVLGVSPEAGRAARELADLGYAVHWVTEDAEVSAPTDERLSLHTDAELIELDGYVGAFRGRVDTGTGVADIEVSGVVVATGNERYYPADRYGIALGPAVLTASQMCNRLKEPRSTREALPHRNLTILLLLDFGGEPTSREMAIETLRLAIDLREQWHCEVYLFYRDLRVDTPGLEALTRRMRDEGIFFARYDDANVSVDHDGVAISYIEGEVQGDLLVLPEAVRPRADTAVLAERLGVDLGEDGYFEDVNIHQVRSGISNRRGVFFAGRCYLDCDIEEALADALQAAANVDALLGAGYLVPDPVIAHVDSAKCIRCLTCVRSCPHMAVEVTEYETEGSDGVVAALVAELACQGCGACVSNCPVQAIELLGQALPAWMQAQSMMSVPATVGGES